MRTAKFNRFAEFPQSVIPWMSESERANSGCPALHQIVLECDDGRVERSQRSHQLLNSASEFRAWIESHVTQQFLNLIDLHLKNHFFCGQFVCRRTLGV